MVGVGRFQAIGRNLAKGKTRRLSVMVLLYLLAGLALWASVEVVLWSEQEALARLASEGRDRLTLYGEALHSELEKSRDIPVVLASEREIIELLSVADPARQDQLRKQVNQRLQDIGRTLNASAIYVLDHQGLTLAASNWQDPGGSFVGRRFDFRPYFTAAMEGRVGRYFALGSTSNRPGYYLAMPVKSGDQIVGAVVVKISLDELERGWRGGGEQVFVTDRFGVVFITNTPAWRFHSLGQLDPEQSQALIASRQYGDMPLPALTLVPGPSVTSVDGVGYVMVSKPLPDGEQWVLHVLMAVKDSQARARDLGLLAVAGASLLIFALYFLIHRDKSQRRHTRDLEVRVIERTAALLETNQRLRGEVAERLRAEAELRAKQDELVQAAKLAALGQMSAGMVHELNQPLAAIRSFADNGLTLLDRGRPERARENLWEIAELTERMARISGQLKLFARKSASQVQPVAVTAAVQNALALLQGRLAADRVMVEWVPPANELWVWGEDLRLQQVLVNLLRNGIDATLGKEARCLRIEAQRREDRVRLQVFDNGTGIAEDVLAQLFDPFFTTKPAGEGLGLGLSISASILGDFGGHLSAANGPGEGAVFTMLLRAAEAP
ncbi:MAG TPA: sensor histidine kinase [Rhodospirillaceae bacterium]|nr:sensor histidine kinase [Rhodospirillaceae bacterium]